MSIISRSDAVDLLQGDVIDGLRKSQLRVTGTVQHDGTTYIVADDLRDQRTVHFLPHPSPREVFDSLWIERVAGINF